MAGSNWVVMAVVSTMMWVGVAAEGFNCPFTLPTSTFTIPRSFKGKNESYNWLISLTTPSDNTPSSGNTACAYDVYIGQFNSTNTPVCMNSSPTITVTSTGCKYYYTNGVTYTILVECDTAATTLQPPSVMVATQAAFASQANLDYTGTFKSAAVCGSGSTSDTSTLGNQVTFVVGTNQIFYPVFTIRDDIAKAINVAAKTITIVADSPYGEQRTLVLSFSTSANANSAASMASGGSLSSSGVYGTKVETPPPDLGNDNTIIIGAAVGGAVFVMIVIGVIAFCIYKKRSNATPVKCEQQEMSPQQYNFGQPINPTPHQQQPSNNIMYTSQQPTSSAFGQPAPAWQQNFTSAPQQPASSIYGNSGTY